VESRRREDWEQLGHTDPLWAILSEPSKRGGRWDPVEFFASGEAEVASLMSTAARLGHPGRFDKALDFGCGVGRVSRALATRFQSVLGVDISASMVEQARAYCAELSNAAFVVADSAALAAFAPRSFDLVYSKLVLQHLQSKSSIRHALRRLARVVGPAGLLVVQLPDQYPLRHRLQPRRRAYGLLRRLGVPGDVLLGRLALSPIRMSGLSQVEVRRILEQSGLVVLEVHAEVLGGSSVDNFTYYATRAGGNGS
jgi:SAM-dependent methyltransferase